MKKTVSSRFCFRDEATREIIFPLGGIGAGSVGLAGNGRLVDWEIFNRPDKGSDWGHTHFIIKAEKDGKYVDARVLNTDLQKDLMGQYHKIAYGGYGYGPFRTTMAGFPHFRHGVFTGTFPFAQLEMEDECFPGKVTLKAFSPFIPRNDKDSSLPAAFFTVEVENTSAEPLSYTAAFTLTNQNHSINTLITQPEATYLFLTREGSDPAEKDTFDLTAAVLDGEIHAQQYWFRGAWFDGPTVFWKNFTAGDLQPRTFDTAGAYDHGTLSSKITVAPGEKKSVRFLMTWSKPNNYNYWSPCKDEQGKDITWKNYYATLFATSLDTAKYCADQWERLQEESRVFCDAVLDTTLPDVVQDAILGTLSVLKSPTLLRLEDGSLYGWEGVHENAGSCEGSCSHVWNYAYAIPFLFPQLERSFRELDFKYNQTDEGKMVFRLKLPLGRERGDFRACLDGQMGGVIKTYREWKLCGDKEWLSSLWPAVKKSLEYAWSDQNPDRWDRDKDGVLEGRQHHTLDMELFGPSSWLEGMYLAALKAGAEMAEAMGEPESAAEYRDLFRKGREFCDKELFNGRYYDQKVDLTDRSVLESYLVNGVALDGGNDSAVRQYWNAEAGEMKYQIDHGCAIDQVLGQWHADLCGLGEIFDREQLLSALQSIYRYNYRSSMRNFVNPCRLYALNDDAGTLMCAYPDDVKPPMVSVPYCEETMHGFEYQAGSMMLQYGMKKEGMDVITAIRDRYAGYNRNPWNEMECGSNYARSMASFALLILLEGFRCDMTTGTLTFAPKMEYAEEGQFRGLWSIDPAWGKFTAGETEVSLEILGGILPLERLELPFLQGKTVSAVEVDGVEVPFALLETGGVALKAEVSSSLRVKL